MPAHPTIALAAIAAVLATSPAAEGCEAPLYPCVPAVIAFPSYTPEGLWLGTIEAPVRSLPELELSRFTRQPLTVLYNDPSRATGAVDPYVTLVPLPRVPRARTQAVYPTGY